MSIPSVKTKGSRVLIPSIWCPLVIGILGFVALPSLAVAQQERPDSFADLAEKLLPTVVNISTTQTIKTPPIPEMPMMPMPMVPQGSPFEDFFQEFFEQYQNGQGGMGGTPLQRQTSSLGSGFIIDGKNGYIVTNNHVIADADEINVILHDDTTLPATVVGRDTKTDIAVLKVDTKVPLVAAPWGDSDGIRVGDWVIAIGNPFGLGGTVTAGIISARQRDINAGPYDDFLQTDASINRGNSGGPMFDLNGGIIGINTAIFSPTGGSIGIGFAVPSNMARPVVEQLIKFGQTKRGWLGVRIQEVTPEIAQSLGLDRARGALVASVTVGGPGEASGLQSGDIILKFNDRPITEMRRLPRAVADTEVGTKATLEIWRDGKIITLDTLVAQLEEAEENGLLGEETQKTPEPNASAEVPKTLDVLGLTISEITPVLLQQFSIPERTEKTGVIILKVDPISNTAAKGLRAGDIILEVDQKPVSTTSEVDVAYNEATSAGKKSILLLTERGSEIRFVAVNLK